MGALSLRSRLRLRVWARRAGARLGVWALLFGFGVFFVAFGVCLGAWCGAVGVPRWLPVAVAVLAVGGFWAREAAFARFLRRPAPAPVRSLVAAPCACARCGARLVAVAAGSSRFRCSGCGRFVSLAVGSRRWAARPLALSASCVAACARARRLRLARVAARARRR